MKPIVNIFDNQFAADTLTLRDKWTDSIVGEFVVAAGVAVFYDSDGPVYEWAMPYDGTRDARRGLADFCGFDVSDLRFQWN